MELLAPVRDEVSLTAAMAAGADAVYLGLGQLNMRVNSRGIEPGSLAETVKKAHARGVKVFAALNAIIYDHELRVVDEILKKIKQAEVDAVICWDFAVIEKARRLGIPIHISTQASVSNSEAVRFYERLGVKRIVLARELNLDQIREIKQNTSMEIEVFVHGAMCVSVSGRCFLSQFLSGRSANRGDCLQPCRREYTVIDKETGDELEVGNGYVMSPKDLCTLAVIDELIEAGIDVFKIEGRSRAPEYIQAVVGAYRRAIDAVENGQYNQELVEELLKEVEKVYHRGFSKGFLLGKPTVRDWSERYGSSASRKKVYVGKVLNYFKKKGMVYIRVESEPLAVDDTVQVQGPTTGVVEMEIEELRTDDQREVTIMDKGKVTFPADKLLRRNDQVFKMIDGDIT